MSDDKSPEFSSRLSNTKDNNGTIAKKETTTDTKIVIGHLAFFKFVFVT